MKPLKQQISITIDEDILEKAKKLAEIDDRSLSQFINLAVKEYVNKITKPYICWFLSYVFFGADLFIDSGGSSLDVSLGART